MFTKFLNTPIINNFFVRRTIRTLVNAKPNISCRLATCYSLKQSHKKICYSKVECVYIFLEWQCPVLLRAKAYRPCYSAYMLSPVRLSVRLSVRRVVWIIEKRLKLGFCNFHHTVAPSLYIFVGKFHSEILRGSPRAERQTREGAWVKSAVFYV